MNPYWIIPKFGRKHRWKVFTWIRLPIRGGIDYKIAKCQRCGIVGELNKGKIYIPRKYNKKEVMRCTGQPYDIYKKRTYRLK